MTIASFVATGTMASLGVSVVAMTSLGVSVVENVAKNGWSGEIAASMAVLESFAVELSSTLLVNPLRLRPSLVWMNEDSGAGNIGAEIVAWVDAFTEKVLLPRTNVSVDEFLDGMDGT